MIDECEGCVLCYKNPGCFYDRIDGCPCKTCLVKVMCKKPCDDLEMQAKRVTNEEDILSITAKQGDLI